MAAVKTGGYSVVELLVALALTVVVVLVAGQLVAEAVELFGTAGQQVRDPAVILTVATVRRDIQDSTGLVSAPVVGWSTAPLDLLSWDGQRVRICHQGDALVRIPLDAMGRPTGRRVLCRGVTAWWWRMVSTSILDVRFTILEHPDPVPGRRSTARRRTEFRRFAIRGGSHGRSW